MNIPEDCRHSGKFKKDCCEVVWNGIIIENDGCVTNGGCDLVIYDDNVIAFVEIKGGRITSSDASKIIEQIDFCKARYNDLIAHRKRYRIFVHCVNGKKRIDKPAREKLRRNKIITKDCKGALDLRI